MMQPETAFKNRARPKIEAVPKSYFEKIQQLALRGVPDFLGTVNSIGVALELKVPPNRVKSGSLQELKLNQMIDAGGYASEVTPENFNDVLHDLNLIGEPDGNFRFLKKQLPLKAYWKRTSGRRRATKD